LPSSPHWAPTKIVLAIGIGLEDASFGRVLFLSAADLTHVAAIKIPE
jgi:hypothetical protein